MRDVGTRPLSRHNARLVPRVSSSTIKEAEKRDPGNEVAILLGSEEFIARISVGSL